MLLLSSINSECRFSCSDSCMIRTENVLTIQLTTTGMVVSNSHSSAVPPLTPKNHLQCRSEDSLLPCSMACGGNKLSAIRIANYNVMYCGTHQQNWQKNGRRKTQITYRIIFSVIISRVVECQQSRSCRRRITVSQKSQISLPCEFCVVQESLRKVWVPDSVQIGLLLLCRRRRSTVIIPVPQSSLNSLDRYKNQNHHVSEPLCGNCNKPYNTPANMQNLVLCYGLIRILFMILQWELTCWP